MGWRVVTEEDLYASMSIAEKESYQNSANWDSDPIQILMKRVIAWCRDQIRTNGNVRLAPDEMSLPEGCISPAMDLLVWDIAKRLGGKVTEERKLARDSAEAYFGKISRRWVMVENYGSSQVERTGGAACEIVQSGSHRLTNDSMENL